MISNLHLIKLSAHNHAILSNNASLRKHNIHKAAFWFAVAGLTIGLLAFIVKIYSVVKVDDCGVKISVFSNFVARLWFEIFHFFTEQTNLLIIICYTLFLTAFKTKLFNRRDFIIACATYINIVMCGYWGAITPSAILTGSFSNNAYELSTTLCFHLFCPIIFDCFTFSSVNYPYSYKNPANRINNNKFWFLITVTLLIYSSYAVAINITQLPADIFKENYCPPEGHRYISVYGPITNFNSKCYNLVYDIVGEPFFSESSTGTMYNFLIAFPLSFLLILFSSGLVYVNNILATPKEMIEKINQINQKTINEENQTFMHYAYVSNRQMQIENKKNNKRK